MTKITNEELARMIARGFETMASKDDIKRVIDTNREIFATKDEVATKQDIEDLKNDFSNLQAAVERYAKKADDYFKEMVVLSHRVTRLEQWMQRIAEKVGVTLEF